MKKTFTQVARNAKDLLGYTYNKTTGKFMNSEGDTATAKEAVKINADLDKNIIDNIAHDKWKMKKLIKFGLEESSTPIVKNPVMKKALEQKARRRDHYSKLWDVQLDPKKMHNQDLKNNMKKWIREADQEKKKPIPKVDVDSISKGISNYMALTKKEKPIQRPEFLDKKFRDPDMDKGIVAIYGGYPKKYI